MEYRYGNAQFKSVRVEDCQQGFVGLELYEVAESKESCVARIIFWDALGQFVVETLGRGIPLEIVEKLIAEAKQSIRIE